MKRTTLRISVAALVALTAPFVAFAQVENYKDIEYPRLPEFRIEKPIVYKLGNGMTVFLMEDHELPLIEVNARIRNGSLWEPAEKTGLARLMGAVQRTGGAGKRTGDEIDDFLANRAAILETAVGADSGFASLNCLKESFDACFGVFADILRSPSFAQDKLDLAKVQESTGIARRNDSPMEILLREFPRLVYGQDSPLGRIPEHSTIASVTRDDLVAWHARFYVPNNVYLGIVGDFDAAEMKKKIQAIFGDWAKGPEVSLLAPAFRKEPNPGVWFIEKGDVNQAYVAMGHLGIETKDPDFFAVQVLNEVLGGSFASRMFSNVRSKKGLAYNVFGSVGSGFLHPGTMRAGLQTKSGSMAAGVEAVRAELVGILENPPTEIEMKRAKDSILNSFIFHYDSKAKILNQQLLYAFYGLPSDFLDRYRTNIEKVSADDVTRVAKKYVRPDQLTLLVVGKAEDFDRPMSTFGAVRNVDITIPPPPDKSPKVAKTTASLQSGRSTLLSAAATLGGPSPASVRAIQTKGSMVVRMEGQSLSMKSESLVVFPDRVRQVRTTPMGDMVAVIKGSEGFTSVGGQILALPGAAIDSAKKELARDLFSLVRHAADPGMEAVATGEEVVDGAECRVIAVTWGGEQSRLWVAPDGRVLRQVYQGENPLNRAPGEIETTFTDYHAVDGRQVWHRQVLKVDGQEILTITYDAVDFDPPVDEKLFEKPAA